MRSVSQKSKLRLPGAPQLLELQGCEPRQPDTRVRVLSPEAEAMGLHMTLKPQVPRAGLTVQAGRSCRGSPGGLGHVAVVLWAAWVSGGCWGHRRGKQGRNGQGAGPVPGCVQCPRQPRSSACLSDEACGGPGGDLGGEPAPKAQLQAEMVLGISLGLPVCPSEPVIHALGRGSNQL